MTYEVQHNRENCIGCGTCVDLCPDYWEMADDGKSQLKSAESLNNKIGWEHVWFENDLDCNKDAESQCPVNVIFVFE
jgi:ferredoxin